jgi:DnaJ-class molecular chaperone
MLKKIPTVISATCPQCKGKGVVGEDVFYNALDYEPPSKCGACNGTGKIWSVVLVEEEEKDID